MSDIPAARVEQVLAEVGLETAADQRAGGFSLGMRQRLALAGALLGEPNVLLLDEPSNGLDPDGIRWLRQHLGEFAARGGTVFVSSHLIGELSMFADDLVVLGPNSGDPLYRKAIRTSIGATLSMPFVQAAQWPGALYDLRIEGFTVVALTPALAAAPLDDIRPVSKLALLVGSEGSGLTREALAAATLMARIPMTPDVDSLNVTTAASIAMYHCFAEKRG